MPATFRTRYLPITIARLYRYNHLFHKRRSKQCFSTPGPRPGTGPWHQLYRAARDSPRICHFSFL